MPHFDFTGLHRLLTLETQTVFLLENVEQFLQFSKNIIANYKLELVGITSHVFENNSYTVALCLQESHICIHTWPEFQTLTLDVYLCNYQQNNQQKVMDISNEYIQFFNARIIKDFKIER